MMMMIVAGSSITALCIVNCCLRRILHIRWTDFVSNDMVRSRMVGHSCQILSVDGACLSLAAFVVPTPVKTILQLFGLANGLDLTNGLGRGPATKDWRRRGRPG